VVSPVPVGVVQGRLAIWSNDETVPGGPLLAHRALRPLGTRITLQPLGTYVTARPLWTYVALRPLGDQLALSGSRITTFSVCGAGAVVQQSLAEFTTRKAPVEIR
jgi:hypothetical protein